MVISSDEGYHVRVRAHPFPELYQQMKQNIFYKKYTGTGEDFV